MTTLGQLMLNPRVTVSGSNAALELLPFFFAVTAGMSVITGFSDPTETFKKHSNDISTVGKQ